MHERDDIQRREYVRLGKEGSSYSYGKGCGIRWNASGWYDVMSCLHLPTWHPLKKVIAIQRLAALQLTRKPVIVLSTKPDPTNQILSPAAHPSFVQDAINSVFELAIRSEYRTWSRKRVVGNVWYAWRYSTSKVGDI